MLKRPLSYEVFNNDLPNTFIVKGKLCSLECTVLLSSLEGDFNWQIQIIKVIKEGF